MPILICHRGNIFDINKSRENSPLYIIEAVNSGYNIEIDVWVKDGILFLGHDAPEYKVDLDFLKMDKLWCHAKNVETLNFLLKENIHCFFHQNDEATITSRGLIWLYPGSRPVSKNCVVVLPENCDYSDQELLSSYAICTDKVDYYHKKLNL